LLDMADWKGGDLVATRSPLPLLAPAGRSEKPATWSKTRSPGSRRCETI